jgi:DNA (cytosine-5)-methyltransferase 1
MRLEPLDAGTPDRAVGEHPLHVVPVWSDAVYRMVAAIPPNSGGTAWQNTKCPECAKDAMGDEDAICRQCGGRLLRPVVIEEDGRARLIRGFRSSSYARMKPDEPAATVTTASGHIGSDRTIHPWENRVLSPLECAELQTFPPEFEWGDTLRIRGATNIRDMIGEAVPPRFTAAHGQVLASLLNGHKPRAVMTSSDQRVLRANEALTRSTERTLLSC